MKSTQSFMSRGDAVRQQINEGAIVASVWLHLNSCHSFIDDL